MRLLDCFREIWAVDFEFNEPYGEQPKPVCLVARELRSGRQIRQFQSEFGRSPPYPLSPDCLFVSYNAPAELKCHLALGWPMPTRILDLYVEFRNHRNRTPQIRNTRLPHALAYFGKNGLSTLEKDEKLKLILRGSPWTLEEVTEILDYCETD